VKSGGGVGIGCF